MDCVKWIEHKGKQILYCDFSKFAKDQYLAGVNVMEKELLQQQPGSKPLLIVNVTDSVMSQETSDRGKKTIQVLTEANISTVTAMVGIAGIKKVIAQALSKDVYFAKDLESAKDWLVEHSK